ncbi:LOW QUALITY PROTEIN: hypothetical protein MC885_012013 [Smutsia gigantea]|nr:LOW QUALITY PROTEIN: hypothetical protein MC885_012013 [Smutsia gigantea]
MGLGVPGPAVPSMQHTRHNPEWVRSPRARRGAGPSSIVGAVADVCVGVEPVVGADGDGHEREGGEGSGGGQQHLQPAVASHHGMIPACTHPLLGTSPGSSSFKTQLQTLPSRTL